MGNFTKSLTRLPSPSNEPQGVTVENFGAPVGAEGAQFYQLDGDTWTDHEGNKYRLAGAHAPETTHMQVDEDGLLNIEYGQPGGEATTTASNAIMKQGGFNRVIRTGEKDQYGRELIRITNDDGDDFAQTLLKTGAVKPGAFTTPEQNELYEFGKYERQIEGVNEYEGILNQLETDLDNGMAMDRILGIPEFARTALDEQERKAGRSLDYANLYDGVEFRSPDRDIDNMANNSLGASFDMGWNGLLEGVEGFKEIIGLTESGEEGLMRLRYIQQQSPEIRNIDFDDVGGVTDFIQYLGNNAAMSAPYLGLLAASALGGPALAAVGTGAAAAVYAGQTWNEMEGEKGATQRGAALAAGVAAATLDRIGLGGIMRPSQFFSKEGREAIIQEMVKQGKAPDAETARRILMQNEKAVGKEVVQHMGDTAGKQLLAKRSIPQKMADAIKRTGFGGASEAITEAGQETLQYVASTQFSDREFDAEELAERIRDAALAGGTLGAGFSAVGTAAAYGDNYAFAKDLERAELDRLSAYDQIREDRRRRGEQLNTVEGIIEDTSAAVSEWEGEQQALKEAYKEAKEAGKKYKGTRTRLGSFAARARKHQAENRGVINNLKQIRSFPEAIAKGIGGMKKLLNAASVTAFNPDELANKNYGKTLSEIRALIGQQRGIIHSGMSFEAHKDRIYGTLGGMVYIPNIMKRFNMRDQSIIKKNRDKVSANIRSFGKFLSDNNLDINNVRIDQVPAEFKKDFEALKRTAQELEGMANAIYNVQNEAILQDGGEGFGYLKGWWWKNQGFDAGKVKQNKEAWMEWMQKNTELEPEQIRDMYDRLESGQINTLDDYFSHVGGVEYIPGSQKSRTANLSEIEGFQQFAQDDIFANLDGAAHSAARFATNRKYWGSGGKKLDYLFDKLQKEGMPEDKLNEVAWYTKSIIDAESGNYNRIDNYTWAGVQRTASTWAVIAGLPLSTLSSIPEFAMSHLGLTRAESLKAISKTGEEIAKTFVEQSKRLADDAIGNNIIIPVDPEGGPVPKSQARLDKAGLLWSPSSAANRLGVGETNITNAWVQDTFFKTIGLTQLTQAQRRINGALVSDYVGNRLAELSAVPNRTQLNNRQQHVWNQLSDLGINVDRMLDLWDSYGNSNTMLDYAEADREIPADIAAEVDNEMQLAVYNFVNAKIQNPGAANRPLFFQDPHWAMLTQFNGFISTFQANVVPKLWNDYLRKGAPSVKYQTFSTIALMMALGAAGQYAKDEIKYGKSSPYLEDWQLMQRAIYSSGVLGQTERLADMALPLYGSRPRSTANWLLDTAIGEAGPTVRNVLNIAEGFGTVAQEGVHEGAQKLAKTAPIVAPLGRLRKGLVGAIFGGEGEAGRQFDYYDNL